MDRSLLRAVDAALNRAMEGLRVCEDIMRFSFSDGPRASRLKEARHGLRGAARAFPPGALLDGRDVEGDGQRFIDLESETEREGLDGLYRANIRRAAEGCRSLEEFSKLLDAPGAAPAFQRIRFSIYQEEKEALPLLTRAAAAQRLRGGLYAILDPSFFEGSIEAMARRLARAGASALQLRMKTATAREFLEEARAVGEACREEGALFIVNDRPDIAVLAGADGVHLGRDDLPQGDARRIVPPGMLVGVSTRGGEGAAAAARDGADYVAVGPVFGTASKHREPLAPIGIEALRDARAALPGCLLVAIGGIDAPRAALAAEAGADAAAVISALYRDGRVEDNCRALIAAFGGKKGP